MKVDILLCVDGTSSMEKVIEDVKANISLFVNNLIQGLRLNSDNDIERIRIKFVVFRNADYDKNDWYQETPFHNLEKSNEKLNEFLKNIKAVGGDPKMNFEDGLMAFSNVLSTANWDSSGKDIQIIGIWTDTESRPINPNHKALREGAPSSYEDLRKYWSNSFLKSYPNARILLFAPDVYPWSNILEEWPNSIHYKSNKVGLEYENPELLLIENLLEELTPSLTQDSVEEFHEEVVNEESELSTSAKTKKPSFWEKHKKILTISFAVFSLSLVSIRVIGFSLFSINVQYTRSVNDSNTIEFRKRLDEITTILKEEGLLSESTEVDYSSSIETRHGLFYDNYDLVLRYSVELSVQNYLLGQYSIREIRETMASAEIIAEHLNLVEDIYAHTGPIKATIIGETDASPIRGEIPYNGEVGKILDISFRYNKGKHFAHIKKGDLIKDNVELGILRASSLWNDIKASTNIFIPKETHVDFEVVTHREFGGVFRKSTLIVRLYDLKDIK